MLKNDFKYKCFQFQEGYNFALQIRHAKIS